MRLRESIDVDDFISILCFYRHCLVLRDRTSLMQPSPRLFETLTGRGSASHGQFQVREWIHFSTFGYKRQFVFLKGSLKNNYLIYSGHVQVRSLYIFASCSKLNKEFDPKLNFRLSALVYVHVKYIYI